jgi:hypothetical protein
VLILFGEPFIFLSSFTFVVSAPYRWTLIKCIRLDDCCQDFDNSTDGFTLKQLAQQTFVSHCRLWARKFATLWICHGSLVDKLNPEHSLSVRCYIKKQTNNEMGSIINEMGSII